MTLTRQTASWWSLASSGCNCATHPLISCYQERVDIHTLFSPDAAKAAETNIISRLLSFSEDPLDLGKCGPSLLPPKLTFISPSTPPSEAEREFGLIQRGYTPQDIEACSQLRSSLDAAGETGLDFHDLCESHSSLEEPQSGRTRNLLQYMKVSSSVQMWMIGD